MIWMIRSKTLVVNQLFKYWPYIMQREKKYERSRMDWDWKCTLEFFFYPNPLTATTMLHQRWTEVMHDQSGLKTISLPRFGFVYWTTWAAVASPLEFLSVLLISSPICSGSKFKENHLQSRKRENLFFFLNKLQWNLGSGPVRPFLFHEHKYWLTLTIYHICYHKLWQ